ncbi:MAG: hypothetical protein ACI85K_001824 [Hyphomicrobiaceae bacterium]|jgi:hypothetical protein
MKQANNRSLMWPMAMTLAALAACDGSTTVGEVGQGGDRPSLLRIEIGRLVDVYAFRRIDPDVGDRRLRSNRELELVASDIVINANIDSQPLFDAAGNPVATANYEFLPFDKNVGHEQLIVLWDDRTGPEQQFFIDALASAQTGLSQLPASYRGQNTQTRPIPIVPRNAAIRLQFSGQLGVTPDFFVANPSAIQLLEFKGDPDVVNPVDAFRILPYRVVPKGDSIILDTTILGGEAAGGITSPGLPLSADNVTANIRVAIPVRGSVLSTFYVDRDGVQELNGDDSAARESVIRDFRSGNLEDGLAGRLSEPETPKIVGSLAMGIIGINAAARTVTVNKRFNFVPIRGRYPFVDGPLKIDGVPLGPLGVPTQRPLRAGDLLVQDVIVQLLNGTFETVTLRAEVLENLRIASSANDPDVGTSPNAPSGDSGQGELWPTAELRVSTLSPGRDSDGGRVSFQLNAEPLGEDCTLRTIYVEEVPFSTGGNVLSDRQWRNQFLLIEPSPAIPGINVDPNASISIEFTKPMDLDQIDNTANMLVTNVASTVESFTDQMSDPKRATTRVVPTRLSDLSGDGTILRLQPPMGFAHFGSLSTQPEIETYSVHVRLGAGGVTDLAGNTLEIFDDIGNPQDAWSVDFTIDQNAEPNPVGWHTYMFSAEDEDGTLPGSVDMFGQFRLENGRLFGATGVRFGRSANSNNLQTVSRINRGECWDSGAPADIVDNPFGFIGTAATANTLVAPRFGQPFGAVPADITNTPHPGLLYWTPQMSDQVLPPNVPQVYEYFNLLPQSVGRVIEPLKPQGSRMQMRYLEDDFTLSYTQPSEFGLDIEQMYWSPFNDETVLYDEFDRFTMSLGHARTRPDERWLLVLDPMDPEAAFCVLDCASMNSSLSTVFADNPLEGSTMTPVFEDKIYAINPNQAFRDGANFTYVPFPKFDRSYTWRDSRLVTVDETGNVIGLGGAQNPDANAPNDDATANVDSPWITSVVDPEFAQFGSGVWVQDPGDFVGRNQRDHDPIALPLLVDMKLFPDDAANGVSSATNGFQVAMLGPPSNFTLPVPNPGGYYDTVTSTCGTAYPSWPRVRVHASGGFDLVTQSEIRIDPANTLSAQQSVVKDAGMGDPITALFRAPAGDGMLHWSRVDFVRKVSTATFGFFDTLQPQRASIVGPNQTINEEAGFPNWLGANTPLSMTDVLVQLDPPQTRQPAGTGVLVELRAAETIENSSELYNPTFGNNPNDGLPDPANNDPGRGNLLNAKYSCEAYRYSTANVAAAPRVVATGLTAYVTEDEVTDIRNPATGLYPRFLNPRLVMTNNVDVSPALSPSLRSMSIIYRLAPSQ